MKLIKIGNKGRHVEIPEGWKLIDQSDIMKKGDKYLHLYERRWIEVDKEDIGHPCEGFCDYVIREE